MPQKKPFGSRMASNPHFVNIYMHRDKLFHTSAAASLSKKESPSRKAILGTYESMASEELAAKRHSAANMKQLSSDPSFGALVLPPPSAEAQSPTFLKDLRTQQKEAASQEQLHGQGQYSALKPQSSQVQGRQHNISDNANHMESRKFFDKRGDCID